MKRVTAVFLCVILLSVCFCGCGAGKTVGVGVKAHGEAGGSWKYEVSKNGIVDIKDDGETGGVKNYTVTAEKAGKTTVQFSYNDKLEGEYCFEVDKDLNIKKWHYIRQNREPAANVPYETRTEIGGIADEKKFVKSTGCGICSTCMMVDNLTDKTLSVEDCVQLSYDTGANHKSGTTLINLAPRVAMDHGLKFKPTNSISVATEHLAQGGMGVVLVHKQPGDEEGLFTNGGHYMAMVGFDGEYIKILDPSFKDDKYTTEGRKGKVKIDYPFVYCTPEILEHEAAIVKGGASTKYYLFSREAEKQP